MAKMADFTTDAEFLKRIAALEQQLFAGKPKDRGKVQGRLDAARAAYDDFRRQRNIEFVESETDRIFQTISTNAQRLADQQSMTQAQFNQRFGITGLDQAQAAANRLGADAGVRDLRARIDLQQFQNAMNLTGAEQDRDLRREMARIELQATREQLEAQSGGGLLENLGNFLAIGSRFADFDFSSGSSVDQFGQPTDRSSADIDQHRF